MLKYQFKMPEKEILCRSLLMHFSTRIQALQKPKRTPHAHMKIG
jgi:hypothetical protein